MTYNEFLRLAKADGWRLSQHGGGHDEYRHPKKKGVLVVPRHGSKEIKKGLLHKLLKIAGIKL